MLHAAAMLTGLFILWLLLTQRWSEPADIALAVFAALIGVAATARLGGLGRGGPFTHAPQLLALTIGRAGEIVSGALACIRAAIAADVTLKPALVRVKTRAASAFARAALSDLISAAPGAVVVETSARDLLVHVIDEDATDAALLAGLEARVLAALDREHIA